ncbi:HigA family addiction module antitoxin [Pseudoroseicyclus sp. CXY001]|uniref:HigA family addiction module antitoxin n=1 Tax=Pseudoroseicyclus sp. CXY001 TaxID=3242492 RepID=UPI003570CDB0
MTSSSATTIERLAPVHPGEVLAEEFLGPLEISAAALARRIGVPPNRVTEIVRGRRGITGDTALRLAEALETSAEFWMNLQKTWELAVAREPNIVEQIHTANEKVFTPLEKLVATDNIESAKSYKRGEDVAEELSVGDRVQLKSGGPVMTVEEITDDAISCVWFEGKQGTKRPVRDVFSSKILTKFKPSTGFSLLR